MTLFSNGQIQAGSVTSSGEFIIGNFSTSGSVLLGVVAPVYIYPIIEYNEDTEMFQIVDTLKAHPVQVRSLSTGELVTSLTGTPTFTVYVNGTLSAETVTISAFNVTMLRYLVTVPASLAVSAYDSVEINVSDEGDGEGFLMVNIVPAVVSVDLTGIATSTNVNDAVTAITGGSETLESLNTAIAGISITGGSSAEKVITGYTYEASTKQITITEAVYLTIKEEQVLAIYNLTKHRPVYSSGDTTLGQIAILDSKITLTNPFTNSFGNDDKFQILINP